MEKIIKTKEEWKKELNEEVYKVTREGGTEAPFTGQYWDEHKKGTYNCSNCGLELFSSTTKFDSGTGWPSFDDPLNKEHVELVEDVTLGMRRTEVVCARCGAHLGHVFNDGPKETTGMRYCMNSCSLDLKEDESL
jgi:peptide-methionine (R)-S-oxide reductase